MKKTGTHKRDRKETSPSPHKQSPPAKTNRPQTRSAVARSAGEVSETRWTMEELLKEVRSIGNKIDGIQANANETKEELHKINLKIDGMMKEWKKEKDIIVAKQLELENRLDRLERNEKRNNVVISGLPSINGAQIKEKVNELFRRELKLEIPLKEVFQFTLASGSTKTIVKLQSSEEKTKIMRAKKDLPKDIFINDDLIKRDRFLRAKGRHFAKTAAGPGDDVRVMTGRVCINKEVFHWCDDSQSFKGKN